MKRALIRAACVSWIGAGVSGTASATISITAVGGLDARGLSVAEGISADGSTVIGRSPAADDWQHAYRWTRAGGIHDIGTDLGAPWESRALGASADGGVVVGVTSVAGSSHYQAFRWSGGSGQVLAPAPGDDGAEALSCSADGSVVVGRSYRLSGGWRAVRWNAAGVAEPISEDAGFSSFFGATGVSADGSVITGSYGVHGDFFRWTSQHGFELISGDGLSVFFAYGLSHDGSTVVGSAGFASGQKAFRWTEAGGFEELGSLPGVWANAYAVNGDGSVVGGESGGHAFLWTPSTGVVELSAYLTGLGLDVSRWNLWEVKGISADGTTLVGTGVLDNTGNTAWVVTGLPAPGSGAVFVAAGFFACRRRR